MNDSFETSLFFSMFLTIITFVYLLDENILLSRCAAWADCKSAPEVIAKLPMLTEMVKLRGTVTSEEIHTVLADLIEPLPPGAKESEVLDRNHACCMNHTAVEMREQLKAQAKLDAAEEKALKRAEKVTFTICI